MTNTVATRNAVPKGVTILFGITAVVITVTLALGSTVCATDASASCPNWPGCYVGRLTPMDATQPWVEFIHRVISASVGIFAVASVIVGIVYRRVDRLLVALPIVALLGALTSGIFGMMTIKWGINAVEASFDLLAAIISMGAMWRAIGGIGMILAIVFLLARWGRRNGWDILCAVLIVIEIVAGILIAVNGSNHGLGTLHAIPAVLILCLTMTATMRSARG